MVKPIALVPIVRRPQAVPDSVAIAGVSIIGTVRLVAQTRGVVGAHPWVGVCTATLRRL